MVLAVSGVDQYNDTVTHVFRSSVAGAVHRRQIPVAAAYLDTERQRQLLVTFGELRTLKTCPSGEKARPVSSAVALSLCTCIANSCPVSPLLQVLLLKRTSVHHAVYDWFSRFCGLDGDAEELLDFVATADLRLPVILPDLVDEFAPVNNTCTIAKDVACSTSLIIMVIIGFSVLEV